MLGQAGEFRHMTASVNLPYRLRTMSRSIVDIELICNQFAAAGKDII